MGSQDFVTLFFLVAAVLIFWQLRSVLGRRTGNEKPPEDLFSNRSKTPSDKPADRSNVITLPTRDVAQEPVNRFAVIDEVAPAGTPLNESLRAIMTADPAFNPKEFLNGAKMAYEMIVMSFADGDRKALKTLLSRDVFDGFDSVISEREKNGEVVKSTFVGIEKADIIAAELKDSEAAVTLSISCQLISATYDKAGAIIDGDAEAVAEVKDIWTFSRDTRSRDPNWKLIATESEH